MKLAGKQVEDSFVVVSVKVGCVSGHGSVWSVLECCRWFSANDGVVLLKQADSPGGGQC